MRIDPYDPDLGDRVGARKGTGRFEVDERQSRGKEAHGSIGQRRGGFFRG